MRGRLFKGAFNRGGVYFENFEKGGGGVYPRGAFNRSNTVLNIGVNSVLIHGLRKTNKKLNFVQNLFIYYHAQTCCADADTNLLPVVWNDLPLYDHDDVCCRYKSIGGRYYRLSHFDPKTSSYSRPAQTDNWIEKKVFYDHNASGLYYDRTTSLLLDLLSERNNRRLPTDRVFGERNGNVLNPGYPNLRPCHFGRD